MPKGARAKMDQVVANIHTSYVGTSRSSLGQDATKEGGPVRVAEVQFSLVQFCKVFSRTVNQN